MGRRVIKELRAHHLTDLFFDFLEKGKLPRKSFSTQGLCILQYPILVIDTIDYFCITCSCGNYPTINFCKSEAKKLDYLTAKLLGIKINESYSAREMFRIFKNKAYEKNMKIRGPRIWRELSSKFYGKEFENISFFKNQ